jgi:hypothetical protein
MKQYHKYIGLDVHKDQNQDEKSPWGPRPSSGSPSPSPTARSASTARSPTTCTHWKNSRKLAGENIVLHFVQEAA